MRRALLKANLHHQVFDCVSRSCLFDHHNDTDDGLQRVRFWQIVVRQIGCLRLRDFNMGGIEFRSDARKE